MTEPWDVRYDRLDILIVHIIEVVTLLTRSYNETALRLDDHESVMVRMEGLHTEQVGINQRLEALLERVRWNNATGPPP